MLKQTNTFADLLNNICWYLSLSIQDIEIVTSSYLKPLYGHYRIKM